MNVKEYLEEFGFYTYKNANEKFNELKDQFIEMGQLKSDFDIEKFTVKKEGSFIAHNFHFLMRQYSLALSELRRMLIDKEVFERKIIKYTKMEDKEITVYFGSDRKDTYADLYVKSLINQLDLLEVTLTNKAMMVRGFEACRLKLIEMNGEKVPTNVEYQTEEPEYWKWSLGNMALRQNKQAKTGISEGVWMNIDYLEEKSLINPAYQVKMLDDNGFLNLEKMKRLVSREKEKIELLDNK